MDYIERLRKYIIDNISEERYGHTRRAEEVAVELADRFGYSKSVAAAAALWHDLARKWTDEDLLAFTEENHLDALTYELENPMLLHGLAGAELFRHWDIPHPFDGNEADDVWKAIRWHTTGHVSMGLYGYILFIADYVEPGRTHLCDEEKDRILCAASLEEMVKIILEMQFAYFGSKGITDVGPGRALYELVCRECGR